MSARIEISIPRVLVKALGARPADLRRKTLEALAAQAYRMGKLTHAQVAELLEIDRWQTDAFLKTEAANRAWENEELAADLETLRRIAR